MTARSHHTGLAVIAVFKVVKGLTFDRVLAADKELKLPLCSRF